MADSVDTRIGSLNDNDRRRGAGEEEEDWGLVGEARPEDAGVAVLECGLVERRLRLGLESLGDCDLGMEGFVVKGEPAPSELEDLCE